MRETSNFDETSSDNELEEQKNQRNLEIFTKQLMRSRAKTDKRFINIFQLRKGTKNVSEREHSEDFP